MATPRYAIRLAPKERVTLEGIARRSTAPHRQVQRARLALLAAKGMGNHEIARTLRCALQTVKTWRKRLTKDRLEALEDRPRSGRPIQYGPRTVVQVKAIACELPAQHHLPFSRFSTSDIHEVLRREGVRPLPSRTTVWRILDKDGLRPWVYRTWIHKRAPDFLEKAGPILDLYTGTFQGKRLDPDDQVLCADEKTGIQVLERLVPTRPPIPNHSGKAEFEYRRHGTVTFVGALDVRKGRVFGTFPERNDAESFRAFVREVMAKEPYARARRVFWITDNGSAHHPKSFGPWLRSEFPQARALHTPVHASWVDQEELFLSILTRKALTPRDFKSKKEAKERIRGFLAYRNQRPRPFRWNYTQKDLAEDLKRWEEEDQKNPGASAAPRARRCHRRRGASPRGSKRR